MYRTKTARLVMPDVVFCRSSTTSVEYKLAESLKPHFISSSLETATVCGKMCVAYPVFAHLGRMNRMVALLSTKETAQHATTAKRRYWKTRIRSPQPLTALIKYGRARDQVP